MTSPAITLPDAARWARLEPLVDELLALPPADRPARLAAIAAEDPATADALQALLRSRDDASAQGWLSDPAAPPTLQPVLAGAGDVLGAWTLVEPIGRGGMGTVWRARRSDGRFDGEAAVKLLASGLFDAAAQERFRREGAILARLQHPGIARLLDAGITRHGQPYLVLELVRGERLDRWCEARARGVRARVELFLQVLDAVAAAHQQLVIHRDVKPSNILVDDAGRAKLLDFGIARLLPGGDDAGQAAPTALTRQGAGPLTPAYAAPEQFDGGALSMATDVYALGVVLHEVLTGSHPSGLPAGSAPLAYLQRAQGGHAVAPSAAAPALARELKGDLDAIVTKACALEAGERYESASALRDDLRRHLNHEPIVARHATPWLRAAKLVRRRPLETAVLAASAVAVPAGAYAQAAVLLSFAAGTGLALWQMRQARAQAARARSEQQRAEAVKTFIASIFERAVPREGQGGVVTAADLLASARSRIAAELQGQPEVAAELMTLVGTSFDVLLQERPALEAYSDAVARCTAAFGRRHALSLRARAGLYCLRLKQAEPGAGEHGFAELAEDLRAALPATAADLVEVLTCRGYACSQGGQEEAALQFDRDAIAVAEQHLGAAAPRTLAAREHLANTLMRLGRYPEAIDLLGPMLDRAGATLSRPHGHLARVETCMASCLLWQGRPAEAERLLAQALHDLQALHGEENKDTLYTRGSLANARMVLGDAAGAAAVQRVVVDIDARLHPNPNADRAVLCWHLGGMLVDAGDIDEGLAWFERAERVLDQVPGGHDAVGPRLIRRSRLAAALLKAGRADEALQVADEVLAAAAQADATSRALALRARVEALTALARLDEAEAAVPAMLAACPPSASQRARTDLVLAELHAARGRWVEARRHARQAHDVLAPMQVPTSSALRRVQAVEERSNAHLQG